MTQEKKELVVYINLSLSQESRERRKGKEFDRVSLVKHEECVPVLTLDGKEDLLLPLWAKISCGLKGKVSAILVYVDESRWRLLV